MKCCICGRPADRLIFLEYGYCSQRHLEQIRAQRTATFEAMRREPRQELPSLVSKDSLRRHLLRVSLEMIWDLIGDDPADYDGQFIPEMFVSALECGVIQSLPVSWARTFDRNPLELWTERTTEIPREVVQAAMDRALSSLGRRGEEF